MSIKPPSRGRPKGAKNRLGRTVRENVVAVFNRLGGTAGMAEWARDNQSEFYRIYARLIPIEAAVNVDMSHSIISILSALPPLVAPEEIDITPEAEQLKDPQGQTLIPLELRNADALFQATQGKHDAP